VSRLFPERVTVYLAGAELRVGERRIPCDPAYGQQPWQGALAALHAMQWKARCKLTVVLSNQFVRYAIVPWSEALAGAAEEEAYVRHHFARVHGERAKSWALRWTAEGDARLASAIDAELLDELKRSFANGAKAKLVSVQPHLMAAANRWRRSVPKTGAWLVLAERERACVALAAGGRWRSVQNAKDSWLSVLERERHRAEGEVPSLVLLAGARAEPQTPGWQVQELPA